MMRSITLTTLLVLAFVVSKAQNYIPARIARDLNPPALIVDSVEVDPNALTRIDPNEIGSIVILKDVPKYPNGAIYVTLKDHRVLASVPREKWLSLKEVTDEKVADEDKQKTRIYILDGQLVTDTTNVKVQPSRYHSVRVVPQNEAPYFKTAMPEALLVLISTKEPGTQIMIRGTERD